MNARENLDICCVALVKGSERYVFFYDDAHCGDLLRIVNRFASDPELSFTHYDAAVIYQRVRQQVLPRCERDNTP